MLIASQKVDTFPIWQPSEQTWLEWTFNMLHKWKQWHFINIHTQTCQCKWLSMFWPLLESTLNRLFIFIYWNGRQFYRERQQAQAMTTFGTRSSPGESCWAENKWKTERDRQEERAKWLWLKECCCSVVIGFVILRGKIAQHWTSMFIHGKRFHILLRRSWPLRCEGLGSDES